MRNLEELFLSEDGIWFVIDETVKCPDLELERWLINRGKLFYAYSLVTGSGAARLQYITTGAKSLHLRINFKAGLGTPVNLVEGVTVTAPGTALARRNYNRAYADNTTEATFFVGGTVTGGTVIRENIAGFGSAPGNATSGEVGSSTFYCLKPNTTYAFNQVPGGSTDTYMLFEFYEVKEE